MEHHEPVAKLDHGKPLAGRVIGDFAKAIQAVVEAGTYGANRYTLDGWLRLPDARHRYTDAMMRHFLAEMSGEEVDPDSGLLHATHLAWNALARLHFILEEKQSDN